MPRRTEAPRTPAPIGESLTAAAISYPGLAKRSQRSPVQKQAWQVELWEMFEAIGEFAFAQVWQSNVCSRARLVVKKRKADGTLEPLPANHAAVKALNELTNGPEGQPEFIRMSVLHLATVAECYFVNREMRKEDAPLRTVAAGTYIWEVVGTEEINDNGGAWTIKYEDGRVVPLTDKDVVIRAWVPHPKNRFRAYSLAKSALPIMREIVGYDAHVQAQQDSRLSGNGFLVFPSEMTLKPPQTYSADSMSTADIVTTMFLDTAALSKVNRGTAESQVPIAMTAPNAMIPNIRHIVTWTPFDEKVVQSRGIALGRMATTLDIPKEVVTGASDMNRWGQWQVEETSIKVHIEPKLDTLCAIVTTEYLQPVTNDQTIVVVPDTATLRMRPNRSKEAIELYDRGALRLSTLLRETGFDPDEDLPDDGEITRWILMQMIKASWTPEMAQAAAKMLGVDLGIPLSTDDTPREARPTPSLDEHPTRDRPETVVDDVPDPDELALTAAAESGNACAVAACLAYRAMERAGNRLRSLVPAAAKPDPSVPPHAVHMCVKVYPDKIEDLLDHAWSRGETFGVDETLLDRGRNYTRFLLSESSPFDLGEAQHYILSGRMD